MRALIVAILCILITTTFSKDGFLNENIDVRNKLVDRVFSTLRLHREVLLDNATCLKIFAGRSPPRSPPPPRSPRYGAHGSSSDGPDSNKFPNNAWRISWGSPPSWLGAAVGGAVGGAAVAALSSTEETLRANVSDTASEVKQYRNHMETAMAALRKTIQAVESALRADISNSATEFQKHRATTETAMTALRADLDALQANLSNTASEFRQYRVITEKVIQALQEESKQLKAQSDTSPDSMVRLNSIEQRLSTIVSLLGGASISADGADVNPVFI